MLCSVPVRKMMRQLVLDRCYQFLISAIAKFKQELKKAAEQANTKANKEVANQATKLSTMLDEVAVVLDSVSKELEKE